MSTQEHKKRDNPSYKKSPQGWEFQIKGDILFQSKEIGIIYIKYSEENCTVFKHGPKKTMVDMLPHLQQIEQKTSQKFKIIDTTNANVEKLNNLINRSALPEKEFLHLNEEIKLDSPVQQQVPLTRECDEITQHLLNGGKILINNPLEKKYQTLDLSLLLDSPTREPIDPKDFKQSLIVWPDGTEVPEEDFQPHEWTHMSDDFTKVNDFDEDMRHFLQKKISQSTTPHKAHISLLPIQKKTILKKPLLKENPALAGLPTSQPTNKISKKDIQNLGEKEATLENEEAYLNAKRALTKNAIAQNQNPEYGWHHLPTYRTEARKKILASPESAKKINHRLESLETSIKKCQTPEKFKSPSQEKPPKEEEIPV